ncbi:MAG: FkbM family methyltransferase [Candidatus Omnitrophica bacterium]|nr:FkbM family methyltransferase [Candidatus Omnitrophota bacterium]MDD5671562.1 FkbM family methyltransferase [Candidatus Omnitrophota bacterium]
MGKNAETEGLVRLLVDKYAKSKTDFFFVEIGAGDGVCNDFIHDFILKYHWHGVLIEPVQYLYEKLVRQYKGVSRLSFENVAISDRQETRDFYHLRETSDAMPVWYDQLGSFNRDVVMSHKDEIPNLEEYLMKEPVPCVTLTSVFEKYHIRHLDLLQIDAEGFDYEIIKSIPFGDLRPQMIRYEHKHLKPVVQEECLRFLRREGYAVLPEGCDTFAY